MVTKEKLREIVDFYLENGREKTVAAYSLSDETFNRYLREAKTNGLLNYDKNKVLRDIAERYSEQELKAIAAGGRIMPGMEPVPVISFEGERIRIGAITDTHIGHLRFSEDRLFQAFEEFRKEKVDFITHSGDTVEGLSHRPGHVYELNAIGYDQQKEMAVKLFSNWTDTDIYAIDGNHDRWFIKSNGAYIVKDIAKELPNFHFLGHDEGDISLKGKAVLKLWHGEDGSSYALCFDDKTEVFTDDGWVLFKDLRHNQMVATLNQNTNKMEFQLPTDYIDDEYHGEMIHFLGQKYDALVTPEHRMWVRRPWKDKWEFVHAKDITQGRQWAINRVIPNWEGHDANVINLSMPSKVLNGVCTNVVNKVDIHLWAEFVGWMLSEGNISHANKRVEISQSKKINPEKYARIVNLIEKMGFTCYQSDKRICINSKQLYEIFADMGHSHEKRIDPSLKMAKISVLKALLEGLFLGDGTIKNGLFQNYTTNSPQLADDIQEILLKCGISATIKRYDNIKSGFKQNRPVYQISCGTKMIEPQLFNSPQRVKYNGRIYCVSVPNQTLLVRRNGKVMWSGNSYRLQKIIESLSGGEKPNVMFAGHVHKFVNIFERNVHCASVGCIEAQTSWMRSKRISAHVGFAIADIWVNKSGVSKFTITWYPFYA